MDMLPCAAGGAALLLLLGFGTGWHWGRSRLGRAAHLAERDRVIAAYPSARDGRDARNLPPDRYP